MQTGQHQKNQKPDVATAATPGFLRRLAAVLYDALLLLAVLFLATALALPFNGGQAFAAGGFFFPIYLLSISYVFYAWFWVHGGQTLGMRAWNIKLCQHDNSAVGWHLALVRFLSAILSWLCLGLGFIWCLFDKQGLSWHDNLSGTRLIMSYREKAGSKK